MKEYEFLLFDADNTLLDFTRAEHDAVCDTFLKFGLPNGEEYVSAYSEINDSYWKMLERGEVLKSDLFWMRFQTFCDKFGFTGIDSRLLAAEYMFNLAKKPFLLDGALDLIEKLHNTGKFKLYLITNGDKKVQDGRFLNTPLAKYFLHGFISEEVGFEKPSLKYFEAVTASIPGFDFKRALVIGDSLTSDIAGGINAGIDTCWYNPKGKAAPDGMNITYTVSDFTEIIGLPGIKYAF